jgi:hypothetical protein
MRLAVIIPDRNDRPRFLENCFRMLKAQTFQPEHIELVNFPAKTPDRYDITTRYRVGYDALRGKGYDLIAFIENDDWYSPKYFEVMIKNWKKNGQPELFGTAYTYYYHIFLRAYYIMRHDQRASAMNTMIKPDLDFAWCHDEEPYTDMHLWKTVRPMRTVFIPEEIISVGIKHNQGLCGGGDAHSTHPQIAKRYLNPDDGFLEKTLDKESYTFYWNYFNHNSQ